MRRGGKALSAGTLVEGYLSSSHFLHKIKQHTAPIIWAEVVGAQVSAATEVMGVENGILRVSTKSSVWANELTFHKRQILQGLNQKLGASPETPYITDILFQNKGVHKKPAEAPLPLHPSADELDDVELSDRELAVVSAEMERITDETLRARVRRVRLSDLRLRTWRLDNGWIPCPRCGDLIPPLQIANACARCRIFR